MKEEKWGFAQPVTFRDPTYGDLQFKAFGTYTLESQTGANIEDILNSNPSITEQVFAIVLQKMIVEMLSHQQEGYSSLPVSIHTENVVNACNEELKNVGVKISKIVVSGYNLTDESANHMKEVTTQQFQSMANNNTVNQTNQVVETPQLINSQIPPENLNTQPTVNNNPPKKKTSPVILVIIVIVGLALIVGKKFVNTDQKDEKQSTVQTQDTVTDTKSYEGKFGFTKIPFKDEDKGIITIKMFGIYTYEIVDEDLFEKEYGKVADIDQYKEVIEEEHRNNIYSAVAQYMAKEKRFSNLYTLFGNDEFLKQVNDNTKEEFKITKVTIESITIEEDNTTPTEVKQGQEKSASIQLLSKEEGGRHTPCFAGITWELDFDGTKVTASVSSIVDDEMMMPGKKYNVKMKLDQDVSNTKEFKIYEKDKEIGSGIITD